MWAVGNYDDVGGGCPQPTLIEHWNGRTWKVVPSQGPLCGNELDGVHVISPDDGWAVGASFDLGGTDSAPLAMHWDGTSWTVQSQ